MRRVSLIHATGFLCLLSGCVADSGKSRSADSVQVQGAEASIAALRPYAAWTVTRDTSLMDGSTNVSASLLSSEAPAMLVLRCAGRKTELFVYTDDVVNGSLDVVPVRIRLDTARPQAQTWSEGSGNHSFFASDPIRTARVFAAAQQVLIEYPKYPGGRPVAKFDMTGAGAAIEAVSQACDWAAADAAVAKRRADAVARQREAAAREREQAAREAERALAQAWIASRGAARVYYRNAPSCGAREFLIEPVYFRTEAEAQAAGYRRSPARGC